MQVSDSHLELLELILREWNRSEEDIKLAEQVCNNIVIPSIKELRYAGRRVVDALIKMKANANEKDIRSLLDDACFDCHRARHDAIDAATSKIAIDIELMASKLSYDAILPAFPEFPNFVRELQELREKIVRSRGNRENREAIYSVLEKENFPHLVDSFKRLQASEPMMRIIARRRRRGEALHIVSIIVAVIAILVAVYFGIK